MDIWVRWKTAAATALLVSGMFASGAEAVLKDVGPVKPSNGFPVWYRDTSSNVPGFPLGLPLEQCLSQVASPNPAAAGGFMCNLLPEPGFDPNAPVAFPTNFPSELFWWAGDAIIGANPSGIQGGLTLGLEGAFGGGPVNPGDQVSFARIRIRIDIPSGKQGTYRVVHPFGTNTFTNVPAGIKAINFTEDLGLGAPGDFRGALGGKIGPFLVWTPDAGTNPDGTISVLNPATGQTEIFVGDPNFTHTVTGSPFNTNYFRVERLGLNGEVLESAETDQFSITGKIYTTPIPSPLIVERASYARTTGGLQLDVFASTDAIGNTTNPSALEINATNFDPTAMATTDHLKFYSHLFNAEPDTLPASLTITNLADNPPTVKTVVPVDEVTITQASYDRAAKSLTIKATSSDSFTPPALATPYGQLDGGVLVVSNVEIVPATVTVVSSAGGADTEPVLVREDFTPPTGSVIINGGAAATGSANVTLTLSATDESGPVATMSFSKDGINFFPFETYATTRSATLVYGPGVNTVYVRFADAAGNISQTYSDTIILDNAVPTGTVTINGGATLTNSTSAVLALSATDNSGSVTGMQFSKDNVTWTAFEPYATTRTITLSAGNGLNTIYVRFRDAAGNVSATVSSSITLDTVAPTGSIVINGGSTITKSAAAVLTLAATDNRTVESMQFSKDNVTWTAFEPFATTRNVTLLPGDGFKTVYVRYRDTAGNLSQVYTAIIVLDTTAPTGSVLLNSGATYATSTTGTMTVSASDANAVTSMQFSRDGVNWFAVEPYSTNRTVNLAVPAGDGVKTVYARFIDAAGNVSAVFSDSIILDTIPPAGSIVINGGAPTTTSSAAVLTLSATDANGPIQMMLSKDGGVTYFPYEPYVTTRNVTLTPPGPGVKTVNVRYRDAAGNVSPTYQATITMQ